MANYIEEIKAKLLPSSLISRHLNLKSKGAGEYLGLCPFHREKTPSFTVSDNKGFYYCFGCGASGDIFSFLMEKEGLPYPEALDRLAKDVGVKIPQHKNDNIKHENAVCYEIFETATSYYQKNLYSENGKKALRYLKGRGLSDDIISKYRLGFAPSDNSHFISYLKSIYTEKDLVKSTVLVSGKYGIYNQFQGRVIFPIRDRLGKVIAFGGRVLDNSMPKYLNSPDNPIFNKSVVLYNLDIAHKEAYKCKKILAVEGYMDVIALANNGISYAVAPMGANIKVDQLKSLWQFVQEPTICMDSDTAGQNAMYKIATAILPHIEHNKSVNFIRLLDGKDPDEVLKKTGKVQFEQLIYKATPLSDYLFSVEYNKSSINTPEEKSNLLHRLKELSSGIDNADLQKNYQYHFKNLFYQNIKKKKGSSNANKSIHIPEVEDYVTANFMIIIRYILLYPQIIGDMDIYDKLCNLELPEDSKLDKMRGFVICIADDRDSVVIDEGDACIITRFKEKFGTSIKNCLSVEQGLGTEEVKENILKYFTKLELYVLKKQIDEVQHLLYSSPQESNYLRLQALKQEEEKVLNILKDN